MSGPALWAAWALAAGAGIPVMASLNGALARTLGSTPAAVVVLFCVALAASGMVLAATGGATTLAGLSRSPPQLLAGGLIVAFYVLSVTHLAPRFGVSNTILFVMVAQIVTSSLIDHFGAFGAAVRPVDARRLFGLAVLVAGLLITQSGRSAD